MFELNKKIFTGLITNIVSASNRTKYVLLSNQKCIIQPTLISLHPNEYSQEFHYYPDRCVESYNTLNDLSNKVCIQNKTEDSDLSVFNMITGINELKTLTKHIPCESKCRFDGRKGNVDQWWNNDKCRCECKKRSVCKKDYVWNPATCNCENWEYLASIIANSAIMCDEIIESYDEDVEAKS